MCCKCHCVTAVIVKNIDEILLTHTRPQSTRYFCFSPTPVPKPSGEAPSQTCCAVPTQPVWSGLILMCTVTWLLRAYLVKTPSNPWVRVGPESILERRSNKSLLGQREYSVGRDTALNSRVSSVLRFPGDSRALVELSECAHPLRTIHQAG